MPDEATIERARQDAREGKSPSTQAGEFVREEMEHIRQGKHGARSTKQAIAIGLSKARRAGVKLPPPRPGKTATRAREQAVRDLRKGSAGRRRPSARRIAARAGVGPRLDAVQPNAACARKARTVPWLGGSTSHHSALADPNRQ